MSRVIELLVNVAILCLCAILSVVLVKKYLIGAPEPDQGVTVGAHLQVPDVDWGRQPQTIVLALQQDCRFCSESAPFYQTLRTEAARRGIPIVAVFPRDEASAQQYLTGLGLSFPTLKVAEFSTLHIRGTPTLLLADRTGTATHVWRGKLTASGERDVIGALVQP